MESATLPLYEETTDLNIHIHKHRMGMKGHPESNCGGGGVGGRGGGWMKKKKTAMVAVVILVGLMGMMVVQKVKDRRLFNIVIKDKDRQILNLHLLLQKERHYAKENKRKNQDLNAKLYSLGTQKNELNNKIMEMRSTIDSLREEQRVLELSIDEKQNRIIHKESEIQGLKSSIQTPPNIWSVSSDDPSNRAVNLTTKIEMHNATDGQNEKSQLQATPDEGSADVNYEGNKTRSEADRMDEDEADTDTDIEADLDSSTSVIEADQDYKDTEE